MDWQPIETAPLEKRVLLWFVGRKAPTDAQCVTIGTVSAYEKDHVWIDGDYRPVDWYSHWAPIPSGPNPKARTR